LQQAIVDRNAGLPMTTIDSPGSVGKSFIGEHFFEDSISILENCIRCLKEFKILQALVFDLYSALGYGRGFPGRNVEAVSGQPSSRTGATQQREFA
jgi:hypothetical protein